MNQTEIETTVDRLGYLAAQMAPLNSEYKKLSDKLKDECGDGAYEGMVFRATISTCEREKLDMDAVRGKLSAQFLRAHTTYTSVTSCRVNARQGIVTAPAPQSPEAAVIGANARIRQPAVAG